MKAAALKSSLLQAGFAPLDVGGEGSIQAVLGNPSVIVPMVVDIREIDAYEFNPRQERNPRYEEIKSSIRETGLDNPLPISRMDSTGRYFIYKGGNTRREVLLDLVLNEGREDLAGVQCYFHPFEGHTAAMVAHHRENGTRADISFIDNAQGIMRIRRQLELEGGEKLSLRALEDELRERGFGVSAGHLSKMEYAVALFAFIPQALKAGMGSDQTTKLRKLEVAAALVLNHWRVVWQALDALDDGVFRAEVFGVALALTDKLVGWQYDEAAVLVAAALQEQGVEQAGDWLPMAFLKRALPLPPVVEEEASFTASECDDGVNLGFDQDGDKVSTTKNSMEHSFMSEANPNGEVPVDVADADSSNAASVCDEEDLPTVGSDTESVATRNTKAALADHQLKGEAALWRWLETTVTGVAAVADGAALPDEVVELLEVCRQLLASKGKGGAA